MITLNWLSTTIKSQQVTNLATRKINEMSQPYPFVMRFDEEESNQLGEDFDWNEVA